MTREEFIELLILERERMRKITRHRPYKAKMILSIIKISKKWKQKQTSKRAIEHRWQNSMIVVAYYIYLE